MEILADDRNDESLRAITDVEVSHEPWSLCRDSNQRPLSPEERLIGDDEIDMDGWCRKIDRR